MIVQRRITLAFLTLCLAVVAFLPQQARAGEIKRVVTSITTDDVNRAAMAIKFTQSIMKQKNVEGVLFFNVYGVKLVNSKMPSPMYRNGESITVMLTDFMKAGGKVIACPMCMKNVGNMTNAELVPGVVAVKGGGVKAVSMPDTLALAY